MSDTMTGTNVRPLGDRLLVKPESATMSAGGLHIPDGMGDKPQVGFVAAVGPGRWEDGRLVPMGVKAADRIMYAKYSGHEVTVDGEEFLILRESDVLAVIE